MIYGYGYVLLTYDFMEPSGADKLKKFPLAHRTSEKEFTCWVEKLACPANFAQLEQSMYSGVQS